MLTSNNTLYLVDDDEIYNYTMKKMIEKGISDYEVKVFQDGNVALTNLINDIELCECPKAIFLDIDMPYLDGWEFLDELDKLNLDHTPRIYVSSSTINPAEISRAEENNLVTEFISKPISREKLQDICNDLASLGSCC